MEGEKLIQEINKAAASEGAAVVAATAPDAFNIEEFLAEFAPDPEPFPVYLPNGKLLGMFKPFTRTAEREAWQKRVSKWFADLPRYGTPAARNHEFGDDLPKTAREAVYARLLADTCVEPGISIKTALMMNRAPDAMLSLQKQIDRGNKAAYISAQLAIEEAEGNDSSGTPDIESD